MTNKQARITIHAIKYLLDNAQYSDDVGEALNMAIEALSNSQKQTNSLIRTSDDDVSEADVIYRADAIDIVNRYDKSHMILKGKPMLGAASIVIELEELPSAQPEIIRCKDCRRAR